MRRLLAAILWGGGAIAAPVAAQPKPLLDLGPGTKAPAPGSDSAGRALAGSLRQVAGGLSGGGAVGEARAGVRELAAALLESADAMGPDGSGRAVLARTLVRGMDEIDGAIGALDPAGLAELSASLSGAIAALKGSGADPWRVVRDALAGLVPPPAPGETVDAWGLALDAPPPDAARIGALPGMTAEARAALDELGAMLREGAARPAYAPSAAAVASLLASVAGIEDLPAWLGADVRAALGARVAGAVAALAAGDDPAAGRDGLAAVAWELALVRDTEAADTGAAAPRIQRALGAALVAPEGQDRAARLRNYSRLLPLLRAAQDLPDEKRLIRQARPSYRVLRATLVGTRARLLLAMPEVLEKPLAMTDPGLVAAVNAHREALEEASRLVEASGIMGESRPGAEPATSDRWKNPADRVLRLGQEMGRPDTRSRAEEAQHEMLQQITRFAQLPGEEELTGVARGMVSPATHAEAWGVLTGGRAGELATRLGMARSRWITAVASKGRAGDDEVRALDDLRALMTVLSALAALDIGPDGAPGAGYAPLQSRAGWELSAEAVGGRAGPVVRGAAAVVAGAIDGGDAELADRIAALREQAGALVLAGSLARPAAAPGPGPASVLREGAIGGPPPGAWLAEQLPAIAGVCRYTEEAAAARKLGDAARAAELERYVAKLAEGVEVPAPAR